MPENDLVSVRYMVDDVEESIDFYTSHFGFAVRHSALPAFADVVRGRLRLLLAGPQSSAGRPMPDGRKPGPGGWNRIHFVVDDIAGEVVTTSSAAPAAGRSCSTIPPATRSRSSSPPSKRLSRRRHAWLARRGGAAQDVTTFVR